MSSLQNVLPGWKCLGVHFMVENVHGGWRYIIFNREADGTETILEQPATVYTEKVDAIRAALDSEVGA